MIHCLQLTPHANIRYRDAQLRLGQAELQCLLRSAGVEASVEPVSIAGIPFLSFSCEPLSPRALNAVSMHSAALMLCQREGELLRPVPKADMVYLPPDLAEVLKYKGKTSAVFTQMMLNCALSASDFAVNVPFASLTVLDPMCGRCTTAFAAMERGMNAVGLDVDKKDLKEASDYFRRYLQFHRLKHAADQRSRTVYGTPVPETSFTLADTKEHFQAGDTRSLTLYPADTALAGELLAKTPAHLLVCDLPYGVQHAPQKGVRTEALPSLLHRALPGWRRALRPGGAMALSFNTLTLRRQDLLRLVEEAGFAPMHDPPYHDFSHFVEQAVVRDLVVARREA